VLKSPLLEHSVAWFECEVVETLRRDTHSIVIGSVVAADVDRSRLPLLFFGSRFQTMSGQALEHPALVAASEMGYAEPDGTDPCANRRGSA
jgi:flavin reductase (DIM6/NTAB) family NADH-FMN oxidoreductase RutF